VLRKDVWVMKKAKLNIGLVTFHVMGGGVTSLSNIIDILCSMSNSLHIITASKATIFTERNYGKNVHVYRVDYKAWGSILARVAKFSYAQLKISYRLLKLSKKVDLWLFFSGEYSLLPMITAKSLRQNAIFVPAGSSSKSGRATNDILAKPVPFLERGNYLLSSKIILYSERLIQEWGLEKYRGKILVAHKHFLNFGKFKIEKLLSERDNLLGYIGRLSQEKGILNFIEAITKVLEMRDDIRFLIGGDGPLRTKVELYLNAENLNTKVKFAGWIPHDELPKCLNDLKLLILPSYTEGLPNIMLEAMACGTPVLATPVGAIPDIIKDGETGFIMENNSLECIARNVIRALNNPNLEEITRNARALVEKEYTYEAAVEGYRKILDSLK